MEVSILASSSQGNCLLIKTPQQQILIDAGLSGRKIESLLSSIGQDITQINALLVTHEHSDHVCGVGVLARRYGLDIYANRKTWQAMSPKIGEIAPAQCHYFTANTTMNLGGIDIESFSVSHDAADPQFYNVHYEGKSFVDVTDTGYVSEKMKYIMRNADGILMECNHDLQMLRQGCYPWPLKQRIISDEGHLSNLDGAQALCDIIGNRTKQVFLGHLSPENNLKKLAHQTVATILTRNDLGVDHDFYLQDTDPQKATPLITI